MKPSAEQSSRSESPQGNDEELYRLALQATSTSVGRPVNSPEVDMAALKYDFWRKMVPIGAVILLILGAIGYVLIGRWLDRHEVQAEAHRVAADHRKNEQEARAFISRALLESDIHGARRILDQYEPLGLPVGVADALKVAIDEAERSFDALLLNQAEEALKRNDAERARQIVKRLSEGSITDSAVRERLRGVQDRLHFWESRQLIEQADTALQAKDIRSALTLLERARRVPFADEDINALESAIHRSAHENINAMVDAGRRAGDLQKAIALIEQYRRDFRSDLGLGNEVDRLRREQVAFLVERGKRVAATGDLDSASKLARDARTLLDPAPAELEQFEQDIKLGRLRVELERSRAALAAGEFNRAIDVHDAARELAQAAQKEYDDVGRELRSRIAGRLEVRSNAASAVVYLEGHASCPAGQVISGLPEGTVKGWIAAEGYLPETLSADVSYPHVTTIPLTMSPEAPGPLWMIGLLDRRPAQRIAIEFYLADPKCQQHHERIAAWRNAVVAMKKSEARKLLKVADEEAIVPEEVLNLAEKELQSESCDAIAVLDRLAALVALRPAAIKLVVPGTGASAIAPVLERLERGCAACTGRGTTICPDCGGKGKRTGPRPCLTCNGKGSYRCGNCNGDTEIRCDFCQGSGARPASRTQVNPNAGPLNRVQRQRQDATCPHCDGAGHKTCKVCTNGIAKCNQCDGTGTKSGRSPCTCGPSGRVDCAICDGTGLRVRMKPDERRRAEEAIIGSEDYP